MAFQGQARDGFATSADYGWCYTDRSGKSAENIPLTYKSNTEGEPIRPDYFLDSQNRDFTSYFFDIFKLPIPATENVYRGRSQDLLFLDGCGLVIKTGDIDVVDLINPAILQPLFWLPQDDTDHVIAIYAGVQLLKPMNFSDSKNNTIINKTKDYLDNTRQKSLDTETVENFGLVNNLGIIIDNEQLFFGTNHEGSLRSNNVTYEHRDRKKEAYEMYREAGCSPWLAIRQVMVELYSKKPEFEKWISVYDYHQSLRQQIHAALNAPNEERRHEMLGAFYQRCRDCVSGKDVEVALYSPWTGNPRDNIQKSNPTTPHPA